MSLVRRSCWSLFLLLSLGSAASAHEVRPAYLELRQVGPDTYSALWKVPARGETMRLSLDVQFPGDCIRLTEPSRTFVDNWFVDRWIVKRPGGLTGARITISGLAATSTDVLARLERLDGTTQVARMTPGAPSFVVTAAPNNLQVAATYLRLGVEHILGGVDHLLFVLGLLLLVRGSRRVLATVTAFTVAHSLTLAAAALGYVHVPQPPVEACIALSIVFVASEIVHAREGRPGLSERWPWMIAFAFGLLHGFGFAGALTAVGLPQRAIPTALFFFNVGVEIGQLLFIALVFAVVIAARRATGGMALPQPGWAWRVAPYAIGTVAAFWLFQRIASFVG